MSTKLTLNLGFRWETTLPPVEQEDRWMDFSPTRPNPAANNILGAAVFAGTGEGQGRHPLAVRLLVRRMGTAHRSGLQPHSQDCDPQFVLAIVCRRDDGDRIDSQSGLLDQSRLQHAGQRRHSGVSVERQFPGLPATSVHQSLRVERSLHSLVPERRGGAHARVQQLELLDPASAHRIDGARPVLQRPGRQPSAKRAA